MDLVSHRWIDNWHRWNTDAAVALARRSIRLHLRLAGRLFGRPGIDCGRVDCRLLVRQKEAARAGRPLSDKRELYLQQWLELARRVGHADRLHACLDWVGGAATQTALRLCVVCGFWRCGDYALTADEGCAATTTRGS